jgi:5-methylcytosine-specific restriction endonuclease McrA
MLGRTRSRLTDFLPKVIPVKKKGRQPREPKTPKEPAPKEPKTPKESAPKVHKEAIPKAVREQTWLVYVGPKFKTKCLVTWCTNEISVFDFHTGHNLPEKKGGTLDISNLRPICARCNLSMGSTYTITQWSALGPTQTAASVVDPSPSQNWFKRLLCWIKK